ncbi:MAG TPA: collagen-like protein [Steroidobacteraceae bacterium]
MKSAPESRALLKATFLVSSVMLALAGCTSIEVGLGLRMRLDKVPVAALSATVTPGPGLAPGQVAHLVLTASSSDGKQWVTVGAGKGNVLFDSFTIAATTVTIDKNGAVSLAADPRVSEGASPEVHVVVVGHQDVTADLRIPIRYDVAYVADFACKPGFKGIDGLSGLSGSDGSPGSTDPANPSAGGRGSDGTHGEDGRDGDAGQSGQAVHVWLTLKGGDHPLLQVRAASKTNTMLFLVDPNGGSLRVDASGGAGGAGGTGGQGGRGGSGGSGFPPGFSGQNGLNGADGHAGARGAAGTIVVSVDPQAQPYLSKLQLINKDGGGAPGPTPDIRVETIPPLW